MPDDLRDTRNRSLPPYEFVRDRPRITQQVRIAPAKAALRSVMEGEDIGV